MRERKRERKKTAQAAIILISHNFWKTRVHSTSIHYNNIIIILMCAMHAFNQFTIILSVKANALCAHIYKHSLLCEYLFVLLFSSSVVKLIGLVVLATLASFVFANDRITFNRSRYFCLIIIRSLSAIWVRVRYTREGK